MATIAPLGKYRAFDDNGGPLALGKLYTYEAGTTTPKATYTTEAGNVANTNPVILDASGYADVWLGDGGYKFVLTDADDAVIFTVDNIGGIGSSAFGGTVNDISTNTSITSVYANSVNICTGTITLSLLDANSAGEGFYFSVKNDGSGVVTIDPDAGETIDGQATKAIPAGGSCLVITDGAEWYTLFFDATANGNNNFTGNNTFSGNTLFTGSGTFTGNVLYPDDGELTIASGEITVTGVNHTVDTEGDAASDDLVTINGGSDGQILTFRIENNARVVVLKSTGNIDLVEDLTLSTTDSPVYLIYDSALSKWLQVSATAAQGAKADTALQPASLTPWVAYTPTFTGFGTVSVFSVFSRRVGDTLEVMGRFTSGTTTSTEARVSLGFNGTNGGLTISNTKVPSGVSIAGPAGLDIDSAAYFGMVTLGEPSVGYLTFGLQRSTADVFEKMLGSSLVSSGTLVSFRASVPITGW